VIIFEELRSISLSSLSLSLSLSFSSESENYDARMLDAGCLPRQSTRLESDYPEGNSPVYKRYQYCRICVIHFVPL
jgi:hypothetical protein